MPSGAVAQATGDKKTTPSEWTQPWGGHAERKYVENQAAMEFETD